MTPQHLQRGPASRVFTLLLGLALTASTELADPAPAQGQVLAAAAGGLVGVVTGIYTTTAIHVARARTGRYLYSVDEALELRPANLPIIAGPVAGVIVGLNSGSAVAGAALWGSVGFVGGGVLGASVGHLAWGTAEGRWAGAILGSAAGLLLGGALGARDRWKRDDEPIPAASASVSIPTPFDQP